MAQQEFVGDKIRRLRNARHVSQMALRRLTGISERTLYRAEVGGAVSPRTAELLAPHLGCRPEDLIADGQP